MSSPQLLENVGSWPLRNVDASAAVLPVLRLAVSLGHCLAGRLIVLLFPLESVRYAHAVYSSLSLIAVLTVVSVGTVVLIHRYFEA